MDNQRDEKTKRLRSRKALAIFIEFYEVASGFHFLHQDTGWDPKGQPKGTKREISGRWKNPSDFLLDFMRSHQDLTFSIRIQDGIPRDDQKDKKENV